MTKSQEALEQFEKLAGGETISNIVRMAHREGYNDGQIDRLKGLFSPGARFSDSVVKRRLDNLLTKLKEKSDG